VFNPSNRMTVEEAMNHRFMKDFKGTEEEKVLPHIITIPFNDNKKYTIKDYREALYQGFTVKKKEDR
jgi:mitogen-activated protein kinase 15